MSPQVLGNPLKKRGKKEGRKEMQHKEGKVLRNFQKGHFIKISIQFLSLISGTQF